MAEYKHIVQTDIGDHGDNGGLKRNLNLSGTSQKDGHPHGTYHKRIGEAGDPQILLTDLLYGRLVRIEPHDRLRKAESQNGKYGRHGHHE